MSWGITREGETVGYGEAGASGEGAEGPTFLREEWYGDSQAPWRGPQGRPQPAAQAVTEATEEVGGVEPAGTSPSGGGGGSAPAPNPPAGAGGTGSTAGRPAGLAGAIAASTPGLASDASGGPQRSKARWKKGTKGIAGAALVGEQLSIARQLYGQTEERIQERKEISATHWTLSPDSSFRRNWDICQTLILLYVAMIVPYRVGFKEPANGLFYWLELMMDLYFVVDVVLNFITGFPDPEEDGVYIMEFHKIVKNYMKAWFFIDLMAILPVDIVIRGIEGRFFCALDLSGSVMQGSCGSTQEGSASVSGQLVRLFKLLRLFRLLKLLRLVRMSRIFERYQDDLFPFLPFLAVVKLLVLLLYLGHIFGCFYFFFSLPDWRSANEKERIANTVGAMPTDDFETWQMSEFGYDDNAAEEANIGTKYIASMYWAFTTMTTVGYGDIIARTNAERAYAIVGMIMGGFVFSGIIGTMTDVIKSLDLSKRAHNQKMQAVGAFIRDTKLPKRFRTRVLKYFRMQNWRAYSDKALLMDLPYNLRKNIIMHRYADILKRIPLFDCASQYLIVEFCCRLRSASYPGGTLVYQRGERATFVYIVSQGAVEFVMDLDEEKEKVLTVLEVGAYFGEEVALGEHQRSMTARCRIASNLLFLDSHEIAEVIKMFPQLLPQLRRTYVNRYNKLMKKGANAVLGTVRIASALGTPGGVHPGGVSPGVAGAASPGGVTAAAAAAAATAAAPSADKISALLMGAAAGAGGGGGGGGAGGDAAAGAGAARGNQVAPGPGGDPDTPRLAGGGAGGAGDEDPAGAGEEEEEEQRSTAPLTEEEEAEIASAYTEVWELRGEGGGAEGGGSQESAAEAETRDLEEAVRQAIGEHVDALRALEGVLGDLRQRRRAARASRLMRDAWNGGAVASGPSSGSAAALAHRAPAAPSSYTSALGGSPLASARSDALPAAAAAAAHAGGGGGGGADDVVETVIAATSTSSGVGGGAEEAGAEAAVHDLTIERTANDEYQEVALPDGHVGGGADAAMVHPEPPPPS